MRRTLQGMSMRAVGMLAMTLLALATVLTFSNLWRKPFEGGAKTKVTADFERAPQLRTGDQVRIDGNIDGKVTDIKPGPRGDEARVTLELDEEAGEVYRDARARLRVKTLLAGAFYVALDRGTPSAGELGDQVIPSERTSVQVEIEDITDIFRGDAIRGLQTLPGEMATAFKDAAPAADAIRTAADIAPDAVKAVRAVRGLRRGDDLPELVDATAKTVKALDSDAADLRRLVSGAAATLGVTGRRAAELRSTIDQSPQVASGLRTTLARLDGTLDITRGLVSRLQRSAADIRPTLAELRPSLNSTNSLLKLAVPTLRSTNGAVYSLGISTPPGNKLIDELQPSFARVDDKILPYFNRKDPITGHSTTVMIGGTAAGFGGASAQQDGNGHFIRFPASVGLSSVYIPCKAKAVDPSAATQLACDNFNNAVKTYMDYLPPLLQASGGSR